MKDACVFGDWHGNWMFAEEALRTSELLHPGACLVHVGDFGLYPGPLGHRYLWEVDRALASPLYVIPGNHEHWPSVQLGSTLGFAGHDQDGFLYSSRYPKIRVSPRAHTWTWGDRHFAAVAGANSIDYEHRTEGRSWWPEESPTSEHVDAVVQLAAGRYVDVLITHDAPFEAIEAANLYPPGKNSGWSSAALAYAHQSSKVIGQARNRLLPTLHVCGHHHVRRSVFIDGTAIEFLSDDSARSLRGNRLHIDLAATELTWG